MKKHEITEEQIRQAYDAACEDWRARIKEWFPDVFKQKSGWYYNNEKNVLSYYDFENINQYGFNHYGKWYQFDNVRLSGSEYPAPETEVFERLKEEAVRRGYKEGTICLFGLSKDKREIKSNNFKYKTSEHGYSALLMGSDVIFRTDTVQWAEIISKQPDQYITFNNHKYKLCQ